MSTPKHLYPNRLDYKRPSFLTATQLPTAKQQKSKLARQLYSQLNSSPRTASMIFTAKIV